MVFKQRRELKRTKIEIIPMIDTMFFLLVFFMLSSLALTKSNGLPVNLPKAGTGARLASLDFTVTINKEQQVYVNKEPVDINDVASLLLAKVKNAQADVSNASVVINADLSVPHGMVVKCIDEARSIGINRFAIATVPETSKP